jgi:monoamine oxidase
MALPEPDRSAFAIGEVARVHPQLRDPAIVSHTASWCWDTHRWSGAAFSLFMPDQHTELFRDVIAPEGRIFFAGEHASLAQAWMQGALDSALRAVDGMLQAAYVAGSRDRQP